MSSSASRKRLEKYKNEGSLSISLRIHGARRGAMQHRVHNLQHSIEDVMQRSQIRTHSIARRYLDQSAHL